MSTSSVFGSSDALAAELVRLTLEASAAALAARGKFTMALTGGSAATMLYPVLAQAPLPWENVHVFYGDERCVPHTHEDSNHRLAASTFLSRVPIPDANIHKIDGTLPPDEGARTYERTLLAVTGDGALDAVHVGVGPDGHVCSLFPGHALLDEKVRLVASLTDSPKPPPARVTLTLPALAKARALWFLVAGNNKAEAVRSVHHDAGSTLPAALASRANAGSRWLLDGEAARLIKNG
jgi:6-phosphogluconolactonase